MKFYKYHHMGNDFILLEDFDCYFDNVGNQLAVKCCHRHLGVGGDGLVIINRERIGNEQAFPIRIYNGDGTETEMCGNAILCVARYLYDFKRINANCFSIITKVGKRAIYLHLRGETVKSITVNLGQPYWDPKIIPVLSNDKVILDQAYLINNRYFFLSCVSVGNPHTVCLLSKNDYENLNLKYWGPLLEKYRLFPRRTNVEFVHVLNPNVIRMKIWERGVGPTLACGTGACATVAVTHKLGLTGRKVSVLLPNGVLRVSVGQRGLFLTGTPKRVFVGVF